MSLAFILAQRRYQIFDVVQCIQFTIILFIADSSIAVHLLTGDYT